MRTFTRLTLIETKSASRHREEGTNMRDIKKLYLIRCSERLEERKKGLICSFPA